jgi:hypothetical protein
MLEATVAYIEERPTGWLVVWRDAETGKKRSRLINWGVPGTAGEEFTKEAARLAAEGLAALKKLTAPHESFGPAPVRLGPVRAHRRADHFGQTTSRSSTEFHERSR